MLDIAKPRVRINDIREGRVRIDSDLAQWVLDDLNYAGQRRVERGHVDALAAMMARKIWLPGSQICFGRFNGQLHLANGQHRLHAVCQTGLTQEFQVLVIDCRDEQELRQLYWRFDAMMRGRSAEQLLNSAGIASDQNVTKAMAKATFSAIGFILNDMSPPVGSHAGAVVERRVIDFRLEACRPLWPHAREYQKAVDKAATVMKRKLLNGGIAAVALLTYRFQRERAALFWEAVAKNDGLRKGDPRHSLMQYLLTTHDKGLGDSFMGACAAAWNAFYAGRTLSLIRPALPIKLNGTPIDGKAKASEVI